MTDPADNRDPFSGRYYAIICVEGEGDPIILLPSKLAADAEFARRQALDADHDDYLSRDHVVLPVDIACAIWNSFDPDPRADDPLSPREIVALF